MLKTYLKEEVINGIRTYKTYISISSVALDPQNPKDISEDKLNDLVDFLEKYGQLNPLLVDIREGHEGNLIGGNQRLKAELRRGTQEIWIEPKDPVTDAQAFEMGTVDNMEFGNYVAEKLKPLLQQNEDELDFSKLGVQIEPPPSFDDLMKQLTGRNSDKPMKYEIIIKCVDENDLMSKVSQIGGLGIAAKKRGK